MGRCRVIQTMEKCLLQFGVAAGGPSVGAGAGAGNGAGSFIVGSRVLDSNMGQVCLRICGDKVTQAADVRLLICKLSCIGSAHLGGLISKGGGWWGVSIPWCAGPTWRA